MTKAGKKRVFVVLNMKEEEDSACKVECKDIKPKKGANKTKSRIIKTDKKPRKKSSSPDLKHNTGTRLESSPPMFSEVRKIKAISQEQINQLIHYIVHDGMSLQKAAVKANMGQTTAASYYHMYLDDPNHNIPAPKGRSVVPQTITQSQLKQLIGYIVHDGMSIAKASDKANMARNTGSRYYRKYKDDPKHKIPTPRDRSIAPQVCTQAQIKRLIHYIVHDGLTITKASTKANMGLTTGMKYYNKYLHNANHTIPSPPQPNARQPNYTHEQVERFVNYIVHDKMCLVDAAYKTGIYERKARYFYKRFLEDGTIPDPQERMMSRLSQAQIKEFIGYIEDDKMAITSAAFKMRISEATGGRLYRKYCSTK